MYHWNGFVKGTRAWNCCLNSVPFARTADRRACSTTCHSCVHGRYCSWVSGVGQASGEARLAPAALSDGSKTQAEPFLSRSLQGTVTGLSKLAPGQENPRAFLRLNGKRSGSGSPTLCLWHLSQDPVVTQPQKTFIGCN